MTRTLCAPLTSHASPYPPHPPWHRNAPPQCSSYFQLELSPRDLKPCVEVRAAMLALEVEGDPKTLDRERKRLIAQLYVQTAAAKSGAAVEFVKELLEVRVPM